MTTWPTVMVTGPSPHLSGRRGAQGTDGHVPPSATANYNPVLCAEAWTLTCDNGTVDQAGMPGRRKQ